VSLCFVISIRKRHSEPRLLNVSRDYQWRRGICMWPYRFPMSLNRKMERRKEKYMSYFFLCFVYRPSLYNLFHIKPTRCKLLLSIFISTSLHVSGNYVLIIRRTFSIYATLVFFTLYGWLSGLQTGQPPI